MGTGSDGHIWFFCTNVPGRIAPFGEITLVPAGFASGGASLGPDTTITYRQGSDGFRLEMFFDDDGSGSSPSTTP